MATNNIWNGEREQLRSLLVSRRQKVTEDLQVRMARIRETGSAPPAASEADDDDSADVDLVMVEIATATLRRIDHAFERLREGSYGVCARCHGAIGAARLRALPFAVCCQACESARERETRIRQESGRRVWAERLAEAAVVRDER
jgi:RNA polymerase-binding transcription factor DksA